MINSLQESSSRKKKSEEMVTPRSKKMRLVESGASQENLTAVEDDAEVIVSKKVRRFDPVWKWFKFVIIEGVEKAICPLHSVNQELEAKTSNLKTHFEAYHKEIADAYCTPTRIKKPTGRRVYLNELYARFLSLPTISLHAVTHPYFRDWLEELLKSDSGWKLPRSHNTNRAKLLREARSIREKLGKMLQEPKYKPSLTVDAWTDCANRSYLAATVHIVGDNDLVLRSYVLGVRQITSRNHRSEVIRQELESLLGVFHVRIGNFTRIVTDNASSMVKAFAYKNSTVLLPNRLNEEEDEETAGKDDISEDSTDGEEENLDVYEFGNEDEFEEEDEFEDEKDRESDSI